MSGPIYYDLEAMWATFTADFAALFAESIALAKDDQSRAFVRAQQKFHEAVTSFCVAFAAAHMETEDAVMAIRSAAGALGQMVASIMANTDHNPAVVSLVFQEISRTVNTITATEPQEGVSRRTAAFSGVEGGHA